jgi:hypothetical protein
MEHTPRVLAVIIMDADGNRLVAKYYPVAAGGRTFQAGGETAYEKKLFKKTKHNHAAAVDSDAVMLDGCVAIFRARGDTFLYVVGAGHENELLLDTVLEGLFVALTILLDGSIESRYVLSNLDIVMLAVDELVDQGKILEVEPKTIANRVLMRGVDGTTTITDMSIQDAMKVAQEQLIKSMS